jgi:hypothetical protein
MSLVKRKKIMAEPCACPLKRIYRVADGTVL